jgi:hypothetical protein
MKYPKKRHSCFQPSKLSPSQDVSEVEIWKLYNKESVEIENDVAKKYKKFLREPESYPQYREEWESFWEHRASELQQKGINIKEHDFHDEWKMFILEKFESLKSTEVKEKIQNLFAKCIAITCIAISDNNSKKTNGKSQEKLLRKSSHFPVESASQGKTRYILNFDYYFF